MKFFIAALFGFGLTAIPLQAGDTLFGQEGSGRPTNTIVGALFGAATGAAIGQATGGDDGWWIGSLVGTAVGGSIGNTLPADGYSNRRLTSHSTVYHSGGYKPRFTRTYSSRSYCPPVVREVVVERERPIIVEESPIIVEQPEVVTDELAPYGFLQEGTIKSPWSDFSMSVGGLSPGQTIYDGFTGKAFRVP